jgi:hypothetical protein
LLFYFCERWQPDYASQYLKGDVVTRWRSIWQVGLHPLAVFASALDPRTNILKPTQKDCKKIGAGVHKKVMEHSKLPSSALELPRQQQEMVSNKNQEKGAAEWQPPGPKSSDLQDIFDLGQESEEDVASEGTMGVEEDAVAHIARQIEGEIGKYKTLSVPPFYGNARLL